MSVENHPNLHAVSFAVEIIETLAKCLRGPAYGEVSRMLSHTGVQALTVNFVADVEKEVDECVEEHALNESCSRGKKVNAEKIEGLRSRISPEGILELSMDDLSSTATFETATLRDLKHSSEAAQKAYVVVLVRGDSRRVLKSRI